MSSAPDLIEMLSLLDSGARTHYDIYTGPPHPTPHGRAFGGHVLGQALVAAGETVEDDRLIHSMHGYFLRPGDSHNRMTFEVARLFDGGSFSTRRVQAYQDGQILMSLIASFQGTSDGLQHQVAIDMDQVPPPEELPTMWHKYGHLLSDGESSRASWMLNRPFDLRYVGQDITLQVDDPSPRMRVWLRSLDTLDVSQMMHRAALAFASDYLLVEPVLQAHGIPWATPGLKTVSLDHAMWFHRPFRADEWLLYELESDTAQSSRGLAHGRFFNRAGELVASVTQESVVRPPLPPDKA